MNALAWHFTAGTLRDGRSIPPIGETLRHDGPVVPCESGLHASEQLIDVLQYAPGLHLHRVTLGGQIVRHGVLTDKLCASERTILWSLPEVVMIPVIVEWARVVAMRAVRKTLAAVLRAAAEGMSDDDAAMLRGHADRCEAAQDLDAAWAAASAARDAASAALAATRVAWAAASAARDAARVARDAAWVAERGRQETELVALVMAAHEEDIR